MTRPWPFAVPPPRRWPVTTSPAATWSRCCHGIGTCAGGGGPRARRHRHRDDRARPRVGARADRPVTRLRVHAAALQPADRRGSARRTGRASSSCADSSAGASDGPRPSCSPRSRRSVRPKRPVCCGEACARPTPTCGRRRSRRSTRSATASSAARSWGCSIPSAGNPRGDRRGAALARRRSRPLDPRACAPGDRRPDDAAYRELVERAANDPDPIVRATAATMPLIGGPPVTETARTLDELDRMVVLRRVPLFSELDPEDLQRIAAGRPSASIPPARHSCARATSATS